MPRTVRVLLFSTAREAAGRSSVDRPVPAGGLSIDRLVDALAEDFPRLKPVLKVSRLVRNGEFVTDLRARCVAGDELAIHPPYSGG